MAIHFTWKPQWPAVRKVLIEESCRPSTQTQWAKLFTIPPLRLQQRYEKYRTTGRSLRITTHAESLGTSFSTPTSSEAEDAVAPKLGNRPYGTAG
jgi:hypothetical protein